ncbi:hypothetical protein D6C78_03906 [Aureobasidium pullulans]|uniref:Uncharacterized protein n=1 Tax=Aureobasidium pullulans TaxID=5580 RepID=A0A4T0BW61_AURPU|nr:hypothetical protein D6C78_03906 [Aureobasidium pullulans]
METNAQQDNTIKDTADSDAKDRATTDKVNMTEETTAKITNDDTLAVDKVGVASLRIRCITNTDFQEKLAHDAFKTLLDTLKQKSRLHKERCPALVAALTARKAVWLAVEQHKLVTRLDLQVIDLDRLQSLDDYTRFMTLDTTFIKRRTEFHVLMRREVELLDEMIKFQTVIRRDHSDRLEQLDARVKEEFESNEAYFLSFQRRMSRAIRIMMTEKRYH